MRILVLGAYGLIGTHVVRRLGMAGHEVVGLGRSVGKARRQFPDVTWLQADLAQLTAANDWAPVLRDARADAIVNSAGVLQDGARDDVAKVQSAAMRALFEAAQRRGIATVVQISASRAGPEADTAFMRTKGEADAALAASALDWTILRPGLVLSPQAYGGTALLRALAAFPVVQPLTLPEARLQCVTADDVADAVLRAVEGRVESRRAYDLVEERPRSLREVVAAFRSWLGLPPAPEIIVPQWAAAGIARVCDGLGWLGWRSPLRTTAIRETFAGVTGDSAPWPAQTGRPLTSLPAFLAQTPATVQEKWFARAFFLKPVVIGVLALFWTVTGLVTLADPDAAARVLTSRGMSGSAASAMALGGAMADIGLGLGILHRLTMPLAAKGMIALTLAYLAGGSLLAPDLWADPLGPLVKAVPAMVLPLVALALAEDR